MIWAFRARMKSEAPYSYVVRGDEFDLAYDGVTTPFRRTVRADGTPVSPATAGTPPASGAATR